MCRAEDSAVEHWAKGRWPDPAACGLGRITPRRAPQHAQPCRTESDGAQPGCGDIEMCVLQDHEGREMQRLGDGEQDSKYPRDGSGVIQRNAQQHGSQDVTDHEEQDHKGERMVKSTK